MITNFLTFISSYHMIGPRYNVLGGKEGKKDK